jgi:hypothetical protein
VRIPPSRSSQVESDGEGKGRCEDGGDVYRVPLEEGVVNDLCTMDDSGSVLKTFRRAEHARMYPKVERS